MELNGKGSLPIPGRCQSAAAAPHGDPGQEGLSLELLLRLWQRSDEGLLQRESGDPSLLLGNIPLAEMSETLPILKARWLAAGDTQAFQAGLQALAHRLWRVVFAKYEPGPCWPGHKGPGASGAGS